MLILMSTNSEIPTQPLLILTTVLYLQYSHVPMPSTPRSIFSCVHPILNPERKVDSTEYTVCQASFPVSDLGPPTPFGSKGGDSAACGGGGGGPNSDEGTHALVLYIRCYDCSTVANRRAFIDNTCVLLWSFYDFLHE
jgi:hypothetical protein